MFKINEDEKRIHFQISSERKNVDRIIRQTREYLAQSKFEVFPEFKIVLREMLINAIEHGNKGDVLLPVVCNIEKIKDDLLSLKVKDKGTGFDHKNTEITMPEDPLTARSRGLALIREFAEGIKFNKKGNEITVVVRPEFKTSFDIKKEEEWHIFKPNGDITASIAENFRSSLNDLIQKGHRHYHFDLGKVEDVDSISLSVFIILYKVLSKEESPFGLVMINVSQDLQNLLRMTQLDRIYDISGS